MSRARVVTLLFAAMAVSGCYTTRITSGRPGSPATVAYDERWHHGVVAGLGEIGGMYDLTAICPQGWAEIVTETTFPNVMAELFSGGVYTPQTVTIRCAAEPPATRPVPPPSPPAPPTPVHPPPPPPVVAPSPTSSGPAGTPAPAATF